MDEKVAPNQITKIRTFKQDYERVKGGRSVSTTATSTNTSPTAIKKEVEKKPEINSMQEVDSITAQVRNRGQEKILPKKIKSVPTPTPTTAAEIPVPEKPAQPSTINPDLSADILAQLNPDERTSVLSQRNNSPTDIGNYVGGGNIITDTKRDRFRLFPAIWHALTGWYKEKEDEIEERFTPKETVAPGKTRTNIIQQAASRSALAPRDDYGKVSERLRHVERAPISSAPLSIKDKEILTPSWSHTGQEAVTADTSAPAEQPLPTPQPEAQTGYTAAVLQTQPDNTVEEVVTQPDPVPQPLAQPVVAEPKPQIAFGSSFAEQPEPAPRFSRTPLIIGATSLAIVTGIVFSFWMFGGDDSDKAVVKNIETGIPQTIASQNTVPVAIGIDRATLLQSILFAQINVNTTVTQVYPTHNAGPATSDEILAVLDWRAPGGFIRNIESIAFGIYRGQSPFIVLQVTSFETAFGGILAWETDMSADLSPLFGQTVSNTFDANARTSTQTRPAFFVDNNIGTLDIRLLKDEKAADRITYTFIDKDTILITTSIAALEEIVAYVKD